MSAETTWNKLLAAKMEELGDEGIPIINCDTPNASFYHGFGATEGSPFVAWTDKYVYVPGSYDGAEYLICAPRNPPHPPMEHQ